MNKSVSCVSVVLVCRDMSVYLLVCLLLLVVLDDLAIQDDSQHLSVDIDSEPCRGRGRAAALAAV